MLWRQRTHRAWCAYNLRGGTAQSLIVFNTLAVHCSANVIAFLALFTRDVGVVAVSDHKVVCTISYSYRMITEAGLVVYVPCSKK